MKKTIDEDELQEAREKAYKDFFGDNWEDFESCGITENKSPQEVLDKYDVDYCRHCNHYFWAAKEDFGIYYCPYCGQLGENSRPDEWADTLCKMESIWEQRNEK